MLAAVAVVAKLMEAQMLLEVQEVVVLEEESLVLALELTALLIQVAAVEETG
jgi:hypothetical protein